eukprot:PhM_4_TR3424/c0_g1_i1/m.534
MPSTNSTTIHTNSSNRLLSASDALSQITKNGKSPRLSRLLWSDRPTPEPEESNNNNNNSNSNLNNSSSLINPNNAGGSDTSNSNSNINNNNNSGAVLRSGSGGGGVASLQVPDRPLVSALKSPKSLSASSKRSASPPPRSGGRVESSSSSSQQQQQFSGGNGNNNTNTRTARFDHKDKSGSSPSSPSLHLSAPPPKISVSSLELARPTSAVSPNGAASSTSFETPTALDDRYVVVQYVNTLTSRTFLHKSTIPIRLQMYVKDIFADRSSEEEGLWEGQGQGDSENVDNGAARLLPSYPCIDLDLEFLTYIKSLDDMKAVFTLRQRANSELLRLRDMQLSYLRKHLGAMQAKTANKLSFLQERLAYFEQRCAEQDEELKTVTAERNDLQLRLRYLREHESEEELKKMTEYMGWDRRNGVGRIFGLGSGDRAKLREVIVLRDENATLKRRMKGILSHLQTMSSTLFQFRCAMYQIRSFLSDDFFTHVFPQQHIWKRKLQRLLELSSTRQNNNNNNMNNNNSNATGAGVGFGSVGQPQRGVLRDPNSSPRATRRSMVPTTMAMGSAGGGVFGDVDEDDELEQRPGRKVVVKTPVGSARNSPRWGPTPTPTTTTSTTRRQQQQGGQESDGGGAGGGRPTNGASRRGAGKTRQQKQQEARREARQRRGETTTVPSPRANAERVSSMSQLLAPAVTEKKDPPPPAPQQESNSNSNKPQQQQEQQPPTAGVVEKPKPEPPVTVPKETKPPSVPVPARTTTTSTSTSTTMTTTAEPVATTKPKPQRTEEVARVTMGDEEAAPAKPRPPSPAAPKTPPAMTITTTTTSTTATTTATAPPENVTTQTSDNDFGRSPERVPAVRPSRESIRIADGHLDEERKNDSPSVMSTTNSFFASTTSASRRSSQHYRGSSSRHLSVTTTNSDMSFFPASDVFVTPAATGASTLSRRDSRKTTVSSLALGEYTPRTLASELYEDRRSSIVAPFEFSFLNPANHPSRIRSGQSRGSIDFFDEFDDNDDDVTHMTEFRDDESLFSDFSFVAASTTYTRSTAFLLQLSSTSFPNIFSRPPDSSRKGFFESMAVQTLVGGPYMMRARDTQTYVTACGPIAPAAAGPRAAMGSLKLRGLPLPSLVSSSPTGSSPLEAPRVMRSEAEEFEEYIRTTVPQHDAEDTTVSIRPQVVSPVSSAHPSHPRHQPVNLFDPRAAGLARDNIETVAMHKQRALLDSLLDHGNGGLHHQGSHNNNNHASHLYGGGYEGEFFDGGGYGAYDDDDESVLPFQLSGTKPPSRAPPPPPPLPPPATPARTPSPTRVSRTISPAKQQGHKKSMIVVWGQERAEKSRSSLGKAKIHPLDVPRSLRLLTSRESKR